MSKLASLTTVTSVLAAMAFSAGCDTGLDSDSDLLEADQGKADDPDGEAVTPLWMGTSGSSAPARVQIERYGDACATGGVYDDPPIYGDWARQRASESNVCFEVWAPGVTDWDNPDIWRELDARAIYRWNDPNSAEPTESEWSWLRNVGFVGNNAQYAFKLTWIDPFYMLASGKCPNVPFVEVDIRSDEWALVDAELLVTFVVNGVEHKPSWDDQGFRVRYQGFVPTKCVAETP